MKLISKVIISGFRSIKHAELDDVGHFSVLAGLNNSGKSNLLRALHAFFTGYTDKGILLKIDEDYYRQEIKKRKKKKKISICVHFSIPAQFKIPKRIENVKGLLGLPQQSQFKIEKQWVRDEVAPRIYLNVSQEPLSLDDRQKIEQFLSLISFRYVPNRVLPIEVIKEEHKSLRDVLVRRLGKKSHDSTKAFEDIKNTSERIIGSLSKHFRSISPDIENIRLTTPTSWAEMVFAFGYRLQDRGVEIDDSAQGAGIQSLLMLETLYLIDRDYFQKFGWRQAAIWAVEEPESSLHSLLEAHASSFLSEVSRGEKGRLQIFATSHSDIVIQYADKCYYIKKDKDGSKVSPHGATEVLNITSQEGITRLSHPLLYQPTKPLLLVEGKYDVIFLKKAFSLLGIDNAINIFCLQDMSNSGASGGVEDLRKYIKEHKKAIKVRPPKAPVVVILDWDAESKKNEFEKIITGAPYKVLVWPASKWNPTLSKNFKGIERYFSERLILAAEGKGANLSRNRRNIISVDHDDYDNVKKILSDIVKNDLCKEDLEFSEEFLKEILNEVRQCSSD